MQNGSGRGRSFRKSQLLVLGGRPILRKASLVVATGSTLACVHPGGQGRRRVPVPVRALPRTGTTRRRCDAAPNTPLEGCRYDRLVRILGIVGPSKKPGSLQERVGEVRVHVWLTLATLVGLGKRMPRRLVRADRFELVRHPQVTSARRRAGSGGST
jgi:hypothetical protein